LVTHCTVDTETNYDAVCINYLFTVIFSSVTVMLTRESLRIRVKNDTETLLQPLQCFASASDTQCELTTVCKKSMHTCLSVFFLTVILLDGRESWVIYSSSTFLPNSFVSPLKIRTIHLKYANYRSLGRCG